MNTTPPPQYPAFDVTVETTPKADVVEVEEDEESKRQRDAALASTFDPALAHHGKTDEELLEERQDDTRLILDAAIVVGIAVAVAEHETLDAVEAVVSPESEDDDGGE